MVRFGLDRDETNLFNLMLEEEDTIKKLRQKDIVSASSDTTPSLTDRRVVDEIGKMTGY